MLSRRKHGCWFDFRCPLCRYRRLESGRLAAGPQLFCRFPVRQHRLTTRVSSIKTEIVKQLVPRAYSATLPRRTDGPTRKSRLLSDIDAVNPTTLASGGLISALPPSLIPTAPDPNRPDQLPIVSPEVHLGKTCKMGKAQGHGRQATRPRATESRESIQGSRHTASRVFDESIDCREGRFRSSLQTWRQGVPVIRKRANT